MSARLDAAEAHLVAADPRFGPLIASSRRCELLRRKPFEPFEALSGSIVYQQLSGKAAATIFGRIPPLFGGSAFPTPAQVLAAAPDHLRPAGVSAAKAVAIRDLAAKVLDGTVPPRGDLHRLSDDEIVERLTAVRGIGRWTVEMLLMFELGRPDVFPVDDLGIRKGFARVFRRPGAKPREMLRRAERWRPWRSVASWYLWRALDAPGGGA